MQWISQKYMGCEGYLLIPQMPSPSSMAIYKNPLSPQLVPQVFITIQYWYLKLEGSRFP